MALTFFRSFSSFAGASALALSLATGVAMAESIFTEPSVGFVGSVRAGSSDWNKPVVPGSAVTVSGQNMVPGQQITLMRGATVLNVDGPIVVDAEGKFTFPLQLDSDAALGLQPVVVIGEKPAAATVAELKISPDLAISGAENFTIVSGAVPRNPYQVVFSKAANAVFVASSVGRPPIKDAAVAKVDADTLQVLASIVPAAAPARPDGRDAGLFGAYGIAVDDANGNVWVTQTRQNTIGVYKQSDLSLVKQFEPGTVNHSRDVVVDEANGRVYASATGTGNIEVFDARTLEKLEPIVVSSAQWGKDFSVMSLDMDAAKGVLVTVSMSTDEAAVIDLATKEAKVFPLAGAKSASGVAYDPQDGILFVASQGTDNVLIVKAADGTVLHDVKTGAGTLNVAFEPVSRLAFVANRNSGTITVVNTSGEIVANLDGGPQPNQLRADGRGNVYAVNLAHDESSTVGPRVWKITPKTK